MTSQLYIIGTPIGNAEDITLRALASLKQLRHLCAEDTRELKKLMNIHGISLAEKVFHSFSSHNMKPATEKILGLLLEGQDVGLVSDRGMPAISDPGAKLVAEARAAGFRITPVPGPSSVTTAFAVSGLEKTSFCFRGFFPEGQKVQEEWIQSAKDCGEAICFFESPKRVQKTLALLAKAFPAGRIFFAREITKAFEEFSWRELADLGDLPEQGEFTLILDPGVSQAEADWQREVSERLLSDKDWSKSVAKRYSVSSSDLYNALHRARRDGSD